MIGQRIVSNQERLQNEMIIALAMLKSRRKVKKLMENMAKEVKNAHMVI